MGGREHAWAVDFEARHFVDFFGKFWFVVIFVNLTVFSMNSAVLHYTSLSESHEIS